MRHLGHLSTMKEQSHMLQAKSAVRSSALPPDTLLTYFLPCSAQIPFSRWRKLRNTPLVKTFSELFHRLNVSEFRQY
ncbi:MAG: hypothetical protein EXX96DRAFT_581362 [Benjaminiella poitrasii]|nr:MAG: hypothetical protein EXX96DRAFT_581362 [Benjaminiella poitrasii]